MSSGISIPLNNLSIEFPLPGIVRRKKSLRVSGLRLPS
jgi:hypothetical protein